MTEPRLMSKKCAADYLGICTRTFDVWRLSGKIPGPIDGTKRWDRKALDITLDRHSKLTEQSTTDAYGEWKNGRGHVEAS